MEKRQNPIIGTWKLLSFEVIKDDETRVNPFGKELNGLLIYHENGYMSGIISGEGRPNISSTASMGISEKERAAIAQNFIAYAGKYHINGDMVIHEIEVSFLPNLIGEKSHSNSFIVMNNKLITVSKNQNLGNNSISVTLEWERVLD